MQTFDFEPQPFAINRHAGIGDQHDSREHLSGTRMVNRVIHDLDLVDVHTAWLATNSASSLIAQSRQADPTDRPCPTPEISKRRNRELMRALAGMTLG